MKTLYMDSAHKYLIIVLADGQEIQASCALSCWKKQSETLFPELIKLMDEAHWAVDDLDEVVITDGPGSYTGVRIAMSVAKVLCTTKNIPLFCLSSLQLYAGLAEHTFVMMDARSQRAYCTLLHKGNFLMEEQILNITDIQTLMKEKDYTFIGDIDLCDKIPVAIDFVKNFVDLRPFAREIKQPHLLAPRYLKEQDAYLVK